MLRSIGRAGEAQLATVSLPVRSQEPYRYTDLESLYRTNFDAAPLGKKISDLSAAKVDEYRMEISKGQQLVFVNGVFSPSLSDVSALGNKEGVVAGHLGGLNGEALEQVRGSRERVSSVELCVTVTMVVLSLRLGSRKRRAFHQLSTCELVGVPMEQIPGAE